MAHREIAFSLFNDVYIRYNSFPTWDAFRKEVLRLKPARFEIGPIYSHNPRDRKTLRKAIFKPIEKELVFDIDLTDYDDIRTCCKQTSICHKCWTYITFAIRTMDASLREDFGFEHILWVYSGRRGAHAWISDKKARQLDDVQRRAIATYLEVVKGKKGVELRRPLHPSVARSLDLLKRTFKEEVLDAQEPWIDQAGAEKLLQRIPDAELREALSKKWSAAKNRPSALKWADLDALAASGAASKGFNPSQLVSAKQDLVLEYMYPRLDVEVSKHLNHLLKSPFCVHPKTGNVCVPIDAQDPESFDPFQVPTVAKLLDELNTWEANHANEGEEVKELPGMLICIE
jgi:DNA primase small subunit